MPITWRSILGPSVADAARPLQQAGDSFNAGFDRMMKTLETAQTVNQGVYDRGQENQLLGFKEALANASSPEEVAAIQGRRDTYLAGLDPKVRAQALGLEDQRTGAIRKNVTEQRTFDENDFIFKNQAVINQAAAMAAKGDVAGAEKLAAPLLAHPIYGKIVADAVAGQREAQKATDAHRTVDATITHQQNQDRVSQGNLEVNRGNLQVNQSQARTHEQEVQLRAQKAMEDRLTSLDTKIAATQSGLTSEAGQKEINDFIKTLPKEDQLRMQDAIGRLAANPKYAGMPAAAAIQAARGDVSLGGPVRKWFWNGTGDSIEARAEEVMNTDAFRTSQAQRDAAIKSLRDQRDVLRQSLYGAARTAPADPGAGSPVSGQTTPGNFGNVDMKLLTNVVLNNESDGRRYGKDGKLLESPKGAKGEMQVLDKTNFNPGYGVTPAKDNSPDERARVGRDYLAAMVREHNGDIPKGLASYNAGPGAVSAAIDKFGDEWLAHMPKETQDYVASGLKKYGAAVVKSASSPDWQTAATTVAQDQGTAQEIANLEEMIANSQDPLNKRMWRDEIDALRKAGAGGSSGSSRPADPVLPPPTQRFNHPEDSVAGRAERRLFKEQEAARVRDEAKAKERQASAEQAASRAKELLASGSTRDLVKFQTSPEFDLLDRDTKTRIFKKVNS